jgi:four helix bundle protein
VARRCGRRGLREVRQQAAGNGQPIQMTVLSYRDLKVRQQAMSLAEAAYLLTDVLPTNEVHGLVPQIRRSAVSIPANIAEGYGRDSTGSYIQFLKTARGSLRELETHVLLAQRLGLIGPERADVFLQKAESVGKMLFALIKALQMRRSAHSTAQR